MTLGFDDRLSGNEFQNSDSSPNFGPKIALWGSVVSTLGDALQVIGGALAIEESIIADKQQQQELDKLQSQIDELKKGQSQNNLESTDIETFNKLLERIVARPEMVDDTKKN
jgi:hypothetical protein